MLHVVDCIEWQGPMCYYWCFPIERYGGWLKRWVGDNNKDTVLALSNRIVREEQVSAGVSVSGRANVIVVGLSTRITL